MKGLQMLVNNCCEFPYQQRNQISIHKNSIFCISYVLDPRPHIGPPGHGWSKTQMLCSTIRLTDQVIHLTIRLVDQLLNITI